MNPSDTGRLSDTDIITTTTQDTGTVDMVTADTATEDTDIITVIIDACVKSPKPKP